MVCPSCNRDIPEQSGIPSGPDLSFCPYCGGKIVPEIPNSCPWEERERLGFIPSIISTLRESLFKPGDFFRNMPVTGGIGGPLFYAMILGTVGIMFGIIWQILFGGMFEIIAQPPGTRKEYGPGFLLTIAILSPFIVIAGVFIGGGILHLCLMILGGNKKGLEATFRVISYANGASILSAIPLCGGIIGAIWTIVLEIIGLKEAHGISGGKAALAVLLPLIVCCGMIILAILIPVLVGTIGSISSMKGIPI